MKESTINKRLNNDNLMHAKLFSLHAAVANETAGERGIYLESEDFIVITQRGKPQLFKLLSIVTVKTLGNHY